MRERYPSTPLPQVVVSEISKPQVMRTFSERLAYGCELLAEDDIDEQDEYHPDYTPMGLGMPHVNGYPTPSTRPRSRRSKPGNSGRRLALLEEDPHCHCEVDNNNSSIDHKQPRSKGGDNSWENTVLACKHCNRLKDDLTYEEFIQLRGCGRQGNAPVS